MSKLIEKQTGLHDVLRGVPPMYPEKKDGESFVVSEITESKLDPRLRRRL